MKNRLISLGVALCVSLLSLTASALEWRSVSFMGAPAIVVSNTISLTNLAVATYLTNWPGTEFTNQQGNKIVVGTTTNASGNYVGASLNLLGSVGLTPYTVPTLVLSNGLPYLWTGPASIVIRGTPGSGTAGTITCVFSALADGTNALTAAAEKFTFSFAATAATDFCIKTNLNLGNQFQNVRAIRCDTITYPNANANGQITLKGVDLVQLYP